MKLSLKLLAGYFLIVGLAGFFVMRIFVAEVKPSVRVTIEENMVDMANLLAEFAAIELRAAQVSAPPPFSQGLFARAVQDFSRREVDAKIHNHEKESLDLRVYVTDKRGIVIFDSSGKDLGKDYSAWRDVYLTLKGQYGARSTREVPGDDKTAIYHVAAPVKSGKEIIGVVTVAKPISTVSPIIDEAEHNIVTKGAWLIIASLIVGLWVSTRLQRSVTRLVRYAEAMARGQSAAKPNSSTRELQQLADAMSGMRDELDGKLYVERYVQALTHELKSPLTALQAHAELLADEVAESATPGHAGDDALAVHEARPGASSRHSAERVLEQTGRIRSLVDQMLVLSRLEGGGSPTLERKDWSLLVQAVVDGHQQAARDLELRLSFSGPGGPAWVQVDANLLSLACSNLIRNALDFSEAGQAVQCTLRHEGGAWVFAVRDHGPGLSSLAREKLFERYFSTPRPGTGVRSSGLGLALAREIVHAHKGQIALDNVQPGCLASIRLKPA